MNLAACQEKGGGRIKKIKVFWSTKAFGVALSDTVLVRTSAKQFFSPLLPLPLSLFALANFHVKSLLNHLQYCSYQCSYLTAPLGTYKINKRVSYSVLKKWQVLLSLASIHSLGCNDIFVLIWR